MGFFFKLKNTYFFVFRLGLKREDLVIAPFNEKNRSVVDNKSFYYIPVIKYMTVITFQQSILCSISTFKVIEQR